jgi:hypothetical protein
MHKDTIETAVLTRGKKNFVISAFPRMKTKGGACYRTVNGKQPRTLSGPPALQRFLPPPNYGKNAFPLPPSWMNFPFF